MALLKGPLEVSEGVAYSTLTDANPTQVVAVSDAFGEWVRRIVVWVCGDRVMLGGGCQLEFAVTGECFSD